MNKEVRQISEWINKLFPETEQKSEFLTDRDIQQKIRPWERDKILETNYIKN